MLDTGMSLRQEGGSVRPSRTDNFPSTWKELENKPQTLSLQVFRDEWRLGDGEIPAPGFENQFSKCQRVTYRPKTRAREPSRWRLGLWKPVDTAPSRPTDSLGKLLCLSLGTFTILHESTWAEPSPEPGQTILLSSPYLLRGYR